MKFKSYKDYLVEDKSFPKDVNTITLDVPLFIRMLELSREDLKSDEQIHIITQNLIDLMRSNKVLTMNNYKKIISSI
jgi:hypothetical protein